MAWLSTAVTTGGHARRRCRARPRRPRDGAGWPTPTWSSASAATARCCAPSASSTAPRSRCSASTSASSATSPRSSRPSCRRARSRARRPPRGTLDLDERLMLPRSRGDQGARAVAGAQRGGRREARCRAHRPPARPHRRRAVHELRRRRADRGHAHRLDAYSPLGAWPGRVAATPGAAAHAGVAAHAVRPTLVLDPSEEVEIEVLGHRRSRGGRRRARRSSSSNRATSCTAVRPPRRPGFIRSAVPLPPDPQRKFGLTDR